MLVFACLIGLSLQADIYLTLSGSTVWNKDCSTTTCTQEFPCTAPATSVVSGATPCNIVLVAEDWGFSYITIAADFLQVRLKDGATSRLRLTVQSSGPVTIFGGGRDSTIYNTSTIVFYSMAQTAGLTLSDFRTLGTFEVAVNDPHPASQVVLKLGQMNIPIGDKTGPIIQWTGQSPTNAMTPVLWLDNVHLTSTGSATLVFAPRTLSRIQIASSNLELAELAITNSNFAVSMVKIASSDLSISSALIDSSGAFPSSPIEIDIANSKLSHHPNFPGLKVACSTLCSFFSQSSEIHSFHFENATLLNFTETMGYNLHIPIQTTTSWAFTSSTIINSAHNASLSFQGPTLGNADVLTYFATGPTDRDNQFTIAGSVAMESSQLIVNTIFMEDGASLKIAKLELTESVQCAGDECSQFTKIFADVDNGPVAEWRLSPILVQNVTLDLRNVPKLVYVPRPIGRTSIDNFGQIILSPSTAIRVLWDSSTIGGNPTQGNHYKIAQFDPTEATPWNVPSFKLPSDPYALTLEWWPIFPELTFSLETCALPYPSGFTCVNGQYVAIGSIDVPVISIPGGAGTLQVIGNLSVGQSITFEGLGSQLNITGCANVPQVEIILKEDEPIPGEPVVLLTQGDGCQSLLGTDISVKANGRGCKKVKVEIDKSKSNGQQLAALFSVDTKDCNVKWIILGSVLGAVLVIVVVLTLVFTLNQSARECIRPYSKSRKTGHTST
jgi:hypothetical protein